MASKTYTHIIVGAGSAGCTLAYRLTEQPDTRVLVLEAGGWDRDPLIHNPMAWPHLFLNRKHDWGYDTDLEPSMGDRPIECARGKVIGGSSSINACAWVRGHRADYDRWAGNALPDWSYAHVLPYFRRQESWAEGPDGWRGAYGPIAARFSRYDDPLSEAFRDAGERAGHPWTDDYNGAQQEGLARWQVSARGARRCSAATGYLRPALARGRVDVAVRCLATRVLFEGHRAIGIEYLKGGSRHTAHAEREVILSGGVINTPQLLMLSGVGDPAQHESLGIPVRVPLRGVGKNLQDHMSAAVAWARSEPGPLHSAMRFDRLARDLSRAYLFGTGATTDLAAPLMAFLRTDASEPIPDVQMFFVLAPMTARPWLEPFVKSYPDGFAVRVVLLRPESRGEIGLASADPRVAPRIRQNFLSTERDRAILRAGLRLARDLGEQAPVRTFIRNQIAPGPGNWADAALDAHIRATGITAHHPVGTCRMGVDDDAVVDPELRVRGTEGLRIVDASVMPDLVGGNTNEPVIMIAEKAADIIVGRAPLAAGNV